MPTLVTLPVEVIAEILRKLPDRESLTAASLTYRTLNSCIEAHRFITADVTEADVGEALLSYLTVAYLGASLPRPFERASFLISNLYEAPEIIRAEYQNMPLNEIRRIGRFHDYVCSLVHEWASDSWTHMNGEKFRWLRAVYRFEIFVHFFRVRGVVEPTLAELRDSFLARHPPWELEQFAAVHDFLKERLIYSTLKTVGRYRAGAFGPYEANWKTWLSQGLDFLRRVEQAESNEDQRDILVTGLANGTAQPRNSIIDYQMGVAERMLDSALPYFSEGQIEAMIPAATRNDDTDEGPYTAWRLAHTGTHDYRWVANPEKETLRMIGYVFWDRDRIERWDLEALCGWLKDGADSISTPSDQESTETTWPSMPNFPTTWAQVLRGRRWR
ncbi:unnamed protein product [Clonostachys rhizophaga]|uniref:F-box domain-containing protein n=1 Tax=Clonostachys rhizophaga TaxID=160324 RepID=A0A9N9YR42_9HYPO|nr:unnamed protein product [Clonostachys rhizophaga]